MALEDCHIIDVDDDGWAIQHPLTCRPNLLDCKFTKAARLLRPVPMGRYIVNLDGEGRLHLATALPTEE